jgi:hypothetical protein
LRHILDADWTLGFSFCTQSQEASETIKCFRLFSKYRFTVQGFLHHLFALIERPRMAFQICSCHRWSAMFQDLCQRASEPIFEDADTPHRMCVAVFPIAPKRWLLRHREMSLKTEDDALKGNHILRIVCLIPSKMDVDAAAAQLRAEISARQQIIGTDEHVDTSSQTGQGLETIQLVSEPPAAGNLGEVLGLVNEKGCWPALPKSLLHSLA